MEEEKGSFIFINKDINEEDETEKLENKLMIDDFFSKRKESRKDSYSSEFLKGSSIFIEKNSVFEQMFTSILFHFYIFIYFKFFPKKLSH